MAKQLGKVNLKNIFDRISPKEIIGMDINTNNLIYSIIGFLQTSDNADNAILLSNLAYILSEKALNVCVVDFKVFCPNLYIYLDSDPNERGGGLMKLLKDDKADFREHINHTSIPNVYLISPSPYDLIEEYLDFEIELIDKIIMNLKDMFDIVLIDIPNIPPLEFFVSALGSCHMGFFICAEKPESINNINKVLEFADSIGINMSKFMNVITVNRQNLVFDYSAYEGLGLNIRASLPFVKGALADSLDMKIYIRDNALLNADFKKEINRLGTILTG